MYMWLASSPNRTFVLEKKMVQKRRQPFHPLPVQLMFPGCGATVTSVQDITGLKFIFYLLNALAYAVTKHVSGHALLRSFSELRYVLRASQT